jgi:hypothetical protein
MIPKSKSINKIHYRYNVPSFVDICQIFWTLLYTNGQVDLQDEAGFRFWYSETHVKFSNCRLHETWSILNQNCHIVVLNGHWMPYKLMNHFTGPKKWQSLCVCLVFLKIYELGSRLHGSTPRTNVATTSLNLFMWLDMHHVCSWGQNLKRLNCCSGNLNFLQSGAAYNPLSDKISHLKTLQHVTQTISRFTWFIQYIYKAMVCPTFKEHYGNSVVTYYSAIMEAAVVQYRPQVKRTANMQPRWTYMKVL